MKIQRQLKKAVTWQEGCCNECAYKMGEQMKKKILVFNKTELLITKIVNKKDKKSELVKIEKVMKEIKELLFLIGSHYPDYEFKWKI